ncbi:MFS transporter [Arsenicicoccus dermatophilus]|uniref:MFS transporter n=1 Tax=Arsenicicoccus dermatophilus TaxID=1076331 RepID=UPI003916E58A
MTTVTAPVDPGRTMTPLVTRMFVGIAFSCLGSGLTMPYLYVYLSQMRHIQTTTVGLVFAMMGFLSSLLAPLGGTLIDRFGPRPVILWGVTVEAVSAYLLGHVDSTARAFGYHFMLINAGFGLGGVIGSRMIDMADVGSFQRLYTLDALSYLAYLVIIASMAGWTGHHAPEPRAVGGPRSGWGVVLRDTRLVKIVLLSVLLLTFGYAQIETGFPAYATDVARIDPRSLGWAFAANAAAVVGAQLVALRLIRGRRRFTMLAVCAATWALAWTVVAACDWVSGPAAVACIVVGMAIFGAGETLWAPLAPALVNDLAPEELRGRYNALQAMTWIVSGIVGPGLGGMLIGHHLPHVWVGLTIGGCLVAALLFPSLRRGLTDAEDGIFAPSAGRPR